MVITFPIFANQNDSLRLLLSRFSMKCICDICRWSFEITDDEDTLDHVHTGSCEDALPLKFQNKRKCKKLETDCSKLKNKCNSTLESAIGSSKQSKNCAKFLSKEDLNTYVKEFCVESCKECGMLILSVNMIQKKSKIYFRLLVEN